MSKFGTTNAYYRERNMKIILEREAGIPLDTLEEKYGLCKEHIMVILRHANEIRNSCREAKSKGLSTCLDAPTQLTLPGILDMKTAMNMYIAAVTMIDKDKATQRVGLWMCKARSRTEAVIIIKTRAALIYEGTAVVIDNVTAMELDMSTPTRYYGEVYNERSNN